VCLLVVCRGLWKAVWWVVLVVHFDVHGYVVDGCNVQGTCYTELGRYGLSCLYAETVEFMCSDGSVWFVWYIDCMICWSLSYFVKFYCC